MSLLTVDDDRAPRPRHDVGMFSQSSRDRFRKTDSSIYPGVSANMTLFLGEVRYGVRA